METANETVLRQFNKDTGKTYSLSDLKKRVRGIRTNFINRLIVIMSEEVNINDRVDIPIIVKQLYDNWYKYRAQKKSLAYLIELCTLLCYAKKARIPSYLKSAYTLPPFYHKKIEE